MFRKPIVSIWLFFVVLNGLGAAEEVQDTEKYTINMLESRNGSVVFQVMYNNTEPVNLSTFGGNFTVRCIQGSNSSIYLVSNSTEAPIYVLKDPSSDRPEEYQHNYCSKSNFREWVWAKKLELLDERNCIYELQHLRENSTYELHVKKCVTERSCLEDLKSVYTENSDLPMIEHGNFWIREDKSCKDRIVTIFWKTTSGQAVVRQYEVSYETLCKGTRITSLEPGYFTACVSMKQNTFEFRRVFRNGTYGTQSSFISIPHSDTLLPTWSLTHIWYWPTPGKVDEGILEWMQNGGLNVTNYTIFWFPIDAPPSFVSISPPYGRALIYAKTPQGIGVGLNTNTSSTGMVPFNWRTISKHFDAHYNGQMGMLEGYLNVNDTKEVVDEKCSVYVGTGKWRRAILSKNRASPDQPACVVHRIFKDGSIKHDLFGEKSIKIKKEFGSYEEHTIAFQYNWHANKKKIEMLKCPCIFGNVARLSRDPAFVPKFIDDDELKLIEKMGKMATLRILPTTKIIPRNSRILPKKMSRNGLPNIDAYPYQSSEEDSHRSEMLRLLDKVSARRLLGRDICINGHVLFSKGINGDNSFFVFARDRGFLRVVAHLVFK